MLRWVGGVREGFVRTGDEGALLTRRSRLVRFHRSIRYSTNKFNPSHALPPITSLSRDPWFFELLSALRLYYTASMPLPSDRSFTESFNSDQRRGFYERHRSIAILMIVIVFLSPFAGLYVTGLFGGVLGVLLSVAGYYLTPYVWLKVGG